MAAKDTLYLRKYNSNSNPNDTRYEVTTDYTPKRSCNFIEISEDAFSRLKELDNGTYEVSLRINRRKL